MRKRYMIKLISLTNTEKVSEVIPMQNMDEALQFMRGYFAAWVEGPTSTIPMLVEYQEIDL